MISIYLQNDTRIFSFLIIYHGSYSKSQLPWYSPIMRRLRSSASLHTAWGLLRLAGQLQRGRRWRRWSAGESARRRGSDILYVACWWWRATDVVAAGGSTTFPLRRRRRSTRQRAVDRRRRTHWRWRPRHVALHWHVSRWRHVARAPCTLGLRTPAHPARRR